MTPPETLVSCHAYVGLTPALSHDQVLKKGLSKRSMISEPFGPTDTRKYCQNLKTWGKTDFLPKKWVKKTLK